MHLITERTADIGCSIETAFAYVSNMERFGEWFPAVRVIHSANDFEHARPGKKYLETVATPLRGERSIMLTVVESELNQRFVTEGAFAPLLPRMEINFRSTGPASCQIRLRMLSRGRGVWLKWLLLPLAQLVMDKRAAIGLARLKKKLELLAGDSHRG